MTESEVRAVAIFFFYALPHELLALEATDKAILRIKGRMAKEPSEISWVHIVRETSHLAESYILKYKKKREKLEEHHFNVNYEKLKDPLSSRTQISFGPWRQFIREEDSRDLFLLIWAHVLEVKTEYIALALNMSHGTVIHRLSKMIQRLGKALVPGSQNEGVGADA